MQATKQTHDFRTWERKRSGRDFIEMDHCPYCGFWVASWKMTAKNFDLICERCARS